MKDTQLMIEESVTNYGLSDIRTLKLSKETKVTLLANSKAIRRAKKWGKK